MSDRGQAPATTVGSTRGERTKQAILDAAVALYAETGSRGTGLIAIGERAGVSHATVLYHFGTAEGLLLAVLDERLRRFDDATAEQWGNRRGDIIRGIPAIAHFNQANRGLTMLYAVLRAESLQPGSPMADYFLAHQRRTEAAYRFGLRAGIDDGEFVEGLDVRATAREIVAFIHGAESDWLVDPQRCPLVPAYERYTDRLLADINR